jgi:hypothetical protein
VGRGSKEGREESVLDLRGERQSGMLAVLYSQLFGGGDRRILVCGQQSAEQNLKTLPENQTKSKRTENASLV